jgi:hypothetical protein
MTNTAASSHRTALTFLLVSVFSFYLGSQFSSVRNETSAIASSVRDIKATSSSNSRGWHQVDVFYGDSGHLEREVGGRPWMSQVDQDHIVFTLLGKDGYFLDLAANDATDLSNTYSLETHHGWDGLCIEANPEYWHRLAARKCQVVGAVLGNQTMEEIQFNYRGALGGIAKSGFDNSNAVGTSESRFTVTFVDVLHRFKVPSLIDYLSLDVEGAESYIMSSFPFNSYQIKIMTVERPKQDLRELLQKNGYVHLSTLIGWGETLWYHESIKSTLNLSNMTLPPP